MIVITGASDGLGQEIAKLYSDTGKSVVSISRRESEFAKHSIICDLTKTDDIAAAVSDVLALEEPLEAVINCAGVMSIEPLEKISASEVERVMATNINAAILLVSGLAKRIQEDSADIVNVASTVGTKGYLGEAAYGASKWAMRGFSANLQAEFKGKLPRVISFCVGGMKTDMSEKIGRPITDPEHWMEPSSIAVFVKQILDLPKNIEVSEIVINRK